MQFKLSSELDLRLQIRNCEKDRMIQVQNGRLHYNWLGHGGGEYPSYDKVKPEFDRTWNALQQFIHGEGLGELRPNQWEVTYVNHIPRGCLWNTPSEWSDIFPLLLVPPMPEGAIRLEGFAGEWHYEIPPQLGRLHVRLDRRLRTDRPEQQEVLVLTITARGAIRGEAEREWGLEEGLHTGHAAIVTAFKELSSKKAHTEWGLIHD